ncbi:MAG: WhiB family transcriptional regulator [Propionibacteriaceae bacterium]
MNWRDQALCLGEDPELFFPTSERRGSRQLERAKSVCAACPVRINCLQNAVDVGAVHGVWGGLSELELRSLNRRLSRAEFRAG